jgi:hypothetical protein
VSGTFCGGTIAMQLFWKWFEERPGYSIRFPKTFLFVKEKHDSHMKAMDEFDAFLKSKMKEHNLCRS